MGVLEIFHAIKGLNNFNLSNYSVQDEAIVYTVCSAPVLSFLVYK